MKMIDIALMKQIMVEGSDIKFFGVKFRVAKITDHTRKIVTLKCNSIHQHRSYVRQPLGSTYK